MLGEQIKGLRLTRNISQVQLAKGLSVTKQTVSNWENNNIMPSVETLIKLARYFNCTTDYLLELNDNRTLLEVTGLTKEQTVHIQLVINDLQTLNQQEIQNNKKQQKRTNNNEKQQKRTNTNEKQQKNNNK